MKFRYAITYGKPNPEIDLNNLDEVKKAFKKHINDVEKQGLKVVFWGSPWGVSEGFVIVYDFGENMESYYKSVVSTVTGSPIIENRTNLVFEW